MSDASCGRHHPTKQQPNMHLKRRTLITTAATGIITKARAAEAITYLTPAPSFLVAFVPHHIAMIRGYFAANNVTLTLQTARGGADAAKQVAVGNADLAGSVGEISMIVRANGLPVRGVLLLGRRPIFRLAIRQALGATSIPDLRGRKIGVLSYQDTAYFSLLAVLAANAMTKSDVQIEAVGNAGLTQLMIAGSLDAIMDTPDWADTIETAGTPLTFIPITHYFPAMGAAVFASDTGIKTRPDAIHGTIQALIRGMTDCLDDPTRAARDFCAAVPQQTGKEAQVTRILRAYISDSYAIPPGETFGLFNPTQLQAIETFYLANNLIEKPIPIDELYTNQFIS